MPELELGPELGPPCPFGGTGETARPAWDCKLERIASKSARSFTSNFIFLSESATSKFIMHLEWEAGEYWCLTRLEPRLIIWGVEEEEEDEEDEEDEEGVKLRVLGFMDSRDISPCFFFSFAGNVRIVDMI